MCDSLALSMDEEGRYEEEGIGKLNGGSGELCSDFQAGGAAHGGPVCGNQTLIAAVPPGQQS